MNEITFKIKKLGDHWYVDLPHFNPNDLSLDPKMERILNQLNVNKVDEFRIGLREQNNIIGSTSVIQFEEQDVVRYLTTDDDFYITIYIKDHQFYITSELYTLLEEQLNLDFSQKLYTLDYIW